MSPTFENLIFQDCLVCSLTLFFMVIFCIFYYAKYKKQIKTTIKSSLIFLTLVRNPELYQVVYRKAQDSLLKLTDRSSLRWLTELQVSWSSACFLFPYSAWLIIAICFLELLSQASETYLLVYKSFNISQLSHMWNLHLITIIL